MALSRIWSAFIIIAVTVAATRFFFVDGEKQIFSSMVIGKNGDSLKVNETSISQADPIIVHALDSLPRFIKGNLAYKKDGDKIIALKAQFVNGIIETCKDAVNICIGLIGIMTLFMGFMSIAEKAGGCLLYTSPSPRD